MAMTPEGKVTKQIRDYLKPLEKQGRIFVVKIAGGPRQRRGLPDLHLIYRGFAIWVEIKRPGKEPTELQASVIKKINGVGGRAFHVTSVGEFSDMLNKEFFKIDEIYKLAVGKLTEEWEM